MSFLSEADHLIKHFGGSDLPENAGFKSERRIDFVVAYHTCTNPDKEKTKKREKFFRILRSKGVRISKGVSSQDGKTVFHHIFMPFALLCDTAEDLGLMLPTRPNDIDAATWLEQATTPIREWWRTRDPFVDTSSTVPDHVVHFCDKFEKSRMGEFVNAWDEDKLFPATWRSRLTLYNMERTQWGPCSSCIGISKLIEENVFDAAYPVHDPIDMYSWKEPNNDRQRLRNSWAAFRHILHYQPLHLLKDYFGHRIAFYFAFLGFYIKFLVPAALAGILFILAGIGHILLDKDGPVQEICNPPNASLYYMCPNCNRECSYYLLSKANCESAKAEHIFDNDMTPGFVVFMMVWAIFFVKFLRRYEKTLAYEWNTMGLHETEVTRPKYDFCAKKQVLDQVTMKMIPKMSPAQKIVKLTGAWAVAVFFILLVLAAMLGVVVYRISVFAVLTSGHFGEKSRVIVSSTAAILNLIIINLLKFVYHRVAVHLTEWENPRTVSEYEASFTSKMFCFQFVNTYASVFYVAFFKSEMIVGWPGNYNHLFGGHGLIRLEGCAAEGCFVETTIQVAILMIGQQFLGNIVKGFIPYCRRKYNLWKHGKGLKSKYMPIWEEDFLLGESNQVHVLYWQYQDAVIQFGFVTMFVAVFPLAPLVALLTNLVELRMDAINLLCYSRRPVGYLRKDIGVWRDILASIVMISVPVNACLIGFASYFIPNNMYRYFYSPDGTMKGVVNFSLSFFNISDFMDHQRPDNPTKHVSYQMPFCRYPGYHEPFKPYKYNIHQWEVFTARLAFAFIFHLSVSILSRIIFASVADVPASLKIKIKRQEYLAGEALREYKIKCGMRQADANEGDPDDTSFESNDEGEAATMNKEECPDEGASSSYNEHPHKELVRLRSITLNGVLERQSRKAKRISFADELGNDINNGSETDSPTLLSEDKSPYNRSDGEGKISFAMEEIKDFNANDEHLPDMV